MKSRYLVFVGLIYLSPIAGANSAQWVAFDPSFPNHFVDTLSIVKVKKDVVRFWDRAGAFPNGDGPDGKFPQYTLREMNCAIHMSRALRWDMALEGGMRPAALQARAKFMEGTAQLQQHYPTEWESLDPSPHDYALLEFVCHTKN